MLGRSVEVVDAGEPPAGQAAGPGPVSPVGPLDTLDPAAAAGIAPAPLSDDAGTAPPPDGLLPGWLGLRLALRAEPTALLLRLALAAAGSGTGYLLLAALSDAVGRSARAGHPPIALARLAWCAVPLAAVALLAVHVVGTRARSTTEPAFATLGFRSVRLPLLAAGEAACLLVPAEAAAFCVFALVPHHAARHAAHLPTGAVVTLLALVPLVCAGACAAALWPTRTGRTRPIAGTALGLASIVCGLAVSLYIHGPAHPVHGAVPLPGGLGRIAPITLLGWGLVMAGPALVGPGLTHLIGQVVSSCRPGALRLLAGRTLQADAGRVGRPLGALSAVACAGVSAFVLRDAGARAPGPLTLLAAVIVLGCPLLALVCGVAHSRHVRSEGGALLAVLGASPVLLRSGALLRAAVLLAVFAPFTLAMCWLAVPLRG